MLTAPPSAAELRAARDEVAQLIRNTSSNPILIRLGWHDAGTFDKVCVGRCRAAAACLPYACLAKSGCCCNSSLTARVGHT
jgi:hypothetical protein